MSSQPIECHLPLFLTLFIFRDLGGGQISAPYRSGGSDPRRSADIAHYSTFWAGALITMTLINWIFKTTTMSEQQRGRPENLTLSPLDCPCRNAERPKRANYQLITQTSCSSQSRNRRAESHLSYSLPTTGCRRASSCACHHFAAKCPLPVLLWGAADGADTGGVCRYRCTGRLSSGDRRLTVTAMVGHSHSHRHRVRGTGLRSSAPDRPVPPRRHRGAAGDDQRRPHAACPTSDQSPITMNDRDARTGGGGAVGGTAPPKKGGQWGHLEPPTWKL